MLPPTDQKTTPIGDLLTASRQAHQHARTLRAKGQHEEAGARFQQALSLRLQAREADPRKQDAAWLEDARVPQSRERRYHRIPGLTAQQVAAQKDQELEAYFRHQLGDSPNTDQTVQSPDILVPSHWQPHKRCETCHCTTGQHRWITGTFTRACHDCDCADELVPTIAKEDTLAFQQWAKEQAASQK